MDFTSNLVSPSIDANVTKYMTAPQMVRPTIKDKRAGGDTTTKIITITNEAIIYLPTLFQGTLNGRLFRAIT